MQVCELNNWIVKKSPDLKLKGVILLKHALELVEPLKGTLSKYTSSILKTSSQMLDDDKFVSILQLIDKYINEETRYQTGSLNQRTQMCFALKVGKIDQSLLKLIILILSLD